MRTAPTMESRTKVAMSYFDNNFALTVHTQFEREIYTDILSTLRRRCQQAKYGERARYNNIFYACRQNDGQIDNKREQGWEGVERYARGRMCASVSLFF